MFLEMFSPALIVLQVGEVVAPPFTGVDPESTLEALLKQHEALNTADLSTET